MNIFFRIKKKKKKKITHSVFSLLFLLNNKKNTMGNKFEKVPKYEINLKIAGQFKTKYNHLF